MACTFSCPFVRPALVVFLSRRDFILIAIFPFPRNASDTHTSLFEPSLLKHEAIKVFLIVCASSTRCTAFVNIGSGVGAVDGVFVVQIGYVFSLF
jgi:hypothetical protein